MEKVNLREKLAHFAEHWKPKIVGELNGQQVKLVKFQGPFMWHHHDHEDELSLVVQGRFRMEFRDRHVWLEEGCETHSVGYIEGWYVDADKRQQGVGRELVRTAEAWARLQGCQEMGSDTEVHNAVSQKAHTALGYQETSRLVHYRKRLD